MRAFAAIRSLCCLLLAVWACQSYVSAQNATSDLTITVWSRSQQFIVTGPSQPAPWTSREIHPKKNPSLQDVVQLSPAELAVSCEQIKQSFLNQLDTTDRSSHRILLNIKPWLPPQSGVYINAGRVRFNNSWRYEVDIPQYIERRKLMSGLVKVLLLEMGNRLNDGESIDVPMWLREGLTEIMLERDGSGLIAEASPIKSTLGNQFWQVDAPTREKVWKDPLSVTRQMLQAKAPLSFSDLSVPVDDQIANVGLEHYQRSAHLFVSELIQLPNGRAKLRTYVQDLFRFTHPQFAFFDAFRAHFTSALEVEKWWSVTQVNFLSRQDRSRWPEKNALAKLNEILQPQVHIRLDTNALPVTETITLKRLIEDYDFDAQRPVLNQMLVQLQQLEWSLPPDMLKLVYDYHILLINYINKRQQLPAANGKTRTATSNAKPLLKETLKQLEYLEILRSDMGTIGISEPSTSSPVQEPVKEFLKTAP